MTVSPKPPNFMESPERKMFTPKIESERKRESERERQKVRGCAYM